MKNEKSFWRKRLDVEELGDKFNDGCLYGCLNEIIIFAVLLVAALLYHLLGG